VKNMHRTGPLLEGFVLVALGLSMIALIISGNYWLYLNPKFEWVTAGAACMLILIGFLAALWSENRVNRSGAAILIAFLCYTIWGNTQVLQPSPLKPKPLPVEMPEEEARTVLNGSEYIRINTVELFGICEEEPHKTGERYTVRGIVLRTPQLDSAGQFVVARLAVFCCLADAVVVGFRVRDDGAAQEFQNGQWVQVYGKLEEAPSPTPLPELPYVSDAGEWHDQHAQTPESPPSELPFKGAVAAAIHPRYIIAPDKVSITEEPELPFMFEFRGAEPYAF
jgi:uncharacterized repeat protein (TIGR03943 family)